MTQTFDYTLTMDSQTLTFTRELGATNVLLTGQYFNGWNVDRAVFSNWVDQGPQSINFRSAVGEDYFSHSPGELFSILTNVSLFPTVNNQPVSFTGLFLVTTRSPSGDNGCPNCPAYTTYRETGTVTETAHGLPEPGILALFVVAGVITLLSRRMTPR